MQKASQMLVLRKRVGAQTHLPKLLISSQADHGFSWLVEGLLCSGKPIHLVFKS